MRSELLLDMGEGGALGEVTRGHMRPPRWTEPRMKGTGDVSKGTAPEGGAREEALLPGVGV